MTQVGIDQQRAPLQLCKSDREFSAQLRSSLGGARAHQDDDVVAPIPLHQEHQFGSQRTDLLAARVIRIMQYGELTAGSDDAALPHKGPAFALSRSEEHTSELQ